MQTKPTIATLALLLGLGLSSCSVDDLTIPPEELYTREFIKQFGAIDPNHNWNIASRNSVTVQTAVPSDVKVMADINGHRYLLADYMSVSGSTKIPFDIPKGINEVIVSVGGRKYTTPVGSTVRAEAAGRVVANAGSEGGSGVTASLCEDSKDWMVVPMLNATIFRRKMPEACYNADRDGVAVDFTFKFTENDIIVRPLYWQTVHNLEFGFFSIDDNGQPVHYPVYQMEKNTENADLSSQVLCWAPTETKSLVVADFMNNAEFKQCLENNGIKIINRTTTWHGDYQYVDINSLDNFDGTTTGTDDHNMTFACREYLISQGIENNSANPEDKRFNYVYRWRFTGEKVKNNNGQEIYDESFKGKSKNPTKDLEIIYTIYNYDYTQAKGWSSNNDMISGVTMDDENYPALISKGIKVHFDDISKTYGGYVKRGDGRYLYSVSSLNEKTRWVPAEGAERTEEYWDYQSGNNVLRYPESAFVKDEAHRAYRAATWVGAKYTWRYMAFEDGVIQDKYNRSSCDFDMQDFVFLIDGADPEQDVPLEVVDPETPVIPEPMEWILAAEDLGGTYDWDFNDVVVAVSTLSTNKVTGADGTETAVEPYTKVSVRSMASGGTLPVYLMYTGKTCRIDADGKPSASEEGTYVVNTEIHHWLGKSSFNPVNVGAKADTGFGQETIFYVPGEYTLAPDSHSTSNMGGFWVLVDRKNAIGITDNDASLKRYDGSLTADGMQAIKAPQWGEQYTAPQMICVEGTWKWPREEHPITNAYSGAHGPKEKGEECTCGACFHSWTHDAGVGNKWYATSDPAHITDR